MERLKWALFRALERASGPAPARGPARSAQGARVVFASTIGELNAIAPFLDRWNEADAAPLWLLSDHAHYEASFKARYPQAEFFAVDAASHSAKAFFARVKPKNFCLAEIPLLPHDAPARLPYAWLREARAAGAKIALINGWLYGNRPACRLDALERRLFARDQLRAFDLITLQREETRDALIGLGVPRERLVVTGSLKFDAAIPREAGEAPIAGRPLIVAGSVNNVPEYGLLLDAFAQLQRSRPEVALVIAPRHPENQPRLDALCQMLAQRGLRHQLRSEGEVRPEVDCLVLDTIGELAGAYGHCRLAHVGINHNVLEPLLREKPTTVCAGWEPRYPSYPVYLALREEGLIHEFSEPRALAEHWQRTLAAPPAQLAGRLAAQRGAGARTLSAFRERGWL